MKWNALKGYVTNGGISFLLTMTTPSFIVVLFAGWSVQHCFSTEWGDKEGKGSGERAPKWNGATAMLLSKVG